MIEKKKIFGKLDNRLFFTTKFVKAGNRQAKSTHRSIMFVGRIGLNHGKKIKWKSCLFIDFEYR